MSDLSQARELIKECQETQNPYLNLGNCGITDLNQLPELFGCTHLKGLYLYNNQITDYRFLEKLTGLQTLNLSYNPITDYRFLEKLTKLQTLDLSYNQIRDISFLEKLTGLHKLFLISNQITDISFLEKLTGLQTLNLSYNPITDYRFFKNLTGLQNLDLNHNQITDYRFLETFTGLQSLGLRNNKIEDISYLEKLTGLQSLNLSFNQISDIAPLASIAKNLNTIYIHNNPYFEENEIVLDSSENHKDILLNELSKLEDKKRGEEKHIKYPEKICLLGNHHSGKTTFLNYFFSNKITKPESTHILNICPYPDNVEEKELPDAIFYDFGGQDYYHGIYKAFLTASATNLLFWHKDTDKNEIGKDHGDEKGKTFHFNRQYWLGQLAYAEGFYKGTDNKAIESPDASKEISAGLQNLYQIQTFADQDPQDIYKHHATRKYIYISLDEELNTDNKKISKQLALKAFTAELKEIIDERKEESRSRKEVNLYQFILDNRDAENKMNVSDLLEHYGKEINLLQAELDQLSKKGLILYYKNAEELRDYVWINPQKTAAEIHEIFTKEETLKEYHGAIPKTRFKEKVKDEQLIELLLHNKVIYLDKTTTDDATYIVPSYLKSTTDGEDRFIFKTFSKYNFSLKFEHFIPFGFINQLICHYGREGELKSYRKDQLIFTQDEGKITILIKLDYQRLLIEVSIDAGTENVKDKEEEIFYDLLWMYWGEEQYRNREENPDSEPALEGKGFFRGEIKKATAPPDMYLSLNGKDYIHYQTLEDEAKTQNSILAYKMIDSKLNKENKDGKPDKENAIKLKDGELDKDNAITLSSRNFAQFSNNRNIKKMKKIFISYSRQDVEYKNELKKHLNMLSHFDIADNWSCEEIKIGNWHEQIQRELESSDLIIYMLSANFFNSKYILEQEVFKGIKLSEVYPKKNILCVIVSDFIGLDKLDDDNRVKSDLQETILKLQKNQYLPYFDKEVNSVTGRKYEQIVPLVRFPQNEIDLAFTQIVEKVQEALR